MMRDIVNYKFSSGQRYHITYLDNLGSGGLACGVPKQPLLDWLRAVDSTSNDLSLGDLRKEPTLCLLAECGSDPEAESLLALACDRIFEEQLDGWYRAPRWFTYSFHSVIVDLCDDPLVAEEL
jgi:hypothetical protein